MSYLLDTDVLIDELHGDAAMDRWFSIHASDALAISVISAAELYHGAYRASVPARHITTVRRLLSRLVVLGISDGIAEIFGREKANLQSRGQVIADFDLLIASTALHFNLTLVTRNVRHYQRVTSLRIESPE